MALIAKKKMTMRLKRTVIGCGVQGEHCLVLAAKGRPGAWKIDWALYGELGDADSDFVRQLRKRVWRRPFWVPIVHPGEGQSVVVRGIELTSPDGGNQSSNMKTNKQSALRTQVMSSYGFATEDSLLRGVELQAEEGRNCHLVGAVARTEAVESEYKGWRQDVGIINPHIGPNAVALANLYLALYPENGAGNDNDRMLVLVGREVAHAVLMRDWRLIDSVQTPILANQDTENLLQMLRQHFAESHASRKPAVPCVIDTPNLGSCEAEIWSPFAADSVVFPERTTRDLVETHSDLAPVAFGMALQGG